MLCYMLTDYWLDNNSFLYIFDVKLFKICIHRTICLNLKSFKQDTISKNLRSGVILHRTLYFPKQKIQAASTIELMVIVS